MYRYPTGLQPNVLEVSFDWKPEAGEEPWLRAYIPNCPVLDLDEGEDGNDDEAEEHIHPGQHAPANAASEQQLRRWSKLLLSRGGPARGLALVATRSIKDGEELLQVRPGREGPQYLTSIALFWAQTKTLLAPQNYRLNPRGPQPSWYTSVDLEEDSRRWAQLPIINVMAPPRASVKG